MPDIPCCGICFLAMCVCVLVFVLFSRLAFVCVCAFVCVGGYTVCPTQCGWTYILPSRGFCTSLGFAPVLGEEVTSDNVRIEKVC